MTMHDRPLEPRTGVLVPRSFLVGSVSGFCLSRRRRGFLCAVEIRIAWKSRAVLPSLQPRPDILMIDVNTAIVFSAIAFDLH
eukprot:1568382-Pleurochrysis_carterae.AAC.2